MFVFWDLHGLCCPFIQSRSPYLKHSGIFIQSHCLVWSNLIFPFAKWPVTDRTYHWQTWPGLCIQIDAVQGIVHKHAAVWYWQTDAVRWGSGSVAWWLFDSIQRHFASLTVDILGCPIDNLFWVRSINGLVVSGQPPLILWKKLFSFPFPYFHTQAKGVVEMSW